MRCAYCHGDLGNDAGRCDGCGTRLHLDCARAAGACPTLGCGRAWAPAQKEFAATAPTRRARWPLLVAAGLLASCLLWASVTPFYPHTPAAFDEEAHRRGFAAFMRRREAESAPVVTASLPPPTLPGDAPPAEVLAACRSLLDRVELRGTRLDGESATALAPALSPLRPALVVVERAAVIVDLGRGRGLVALPADGRWEDVETFAGTRSYALEQVTEGLWLYTRW